MLPPPASRSRGRKTCAQRNGPLRLVARMESQSASVTWSKSVGLLMPALLTRIEMGPSARASFAAAEALDLVHHGIRLGAFLAIGQRYVGAGLRQTQRDGASDAAAAAGDDRVSAREREALHHILPLRAMARLAASAMLLEPSPNITASSSGSPEAPNTSFTPTNSMGQG